MSEYIPDYLPTGTYFNQAKAQRVIDFIERFCRLPEGNAECGTKAGDKMVLLPWQLRLIYKAYGVLKSNNLRNYLEGYLEIGRKNGKTVFGAALALYHLVADGEMSAQVFSVASTRKQAGILFEAARKMVMFSPQLRKILVVQKNGIYYPKTFSYYQVLASEAGANHGYNPSAVFMDELHKIDDGGALYEALSTGQSARAQPMMFSLTTAGDNLDTKCYAMHCYSKDLEVGTMKNDTFFHFIYGIDPKVDDWKDEEVWRKVNPSLGTTMSIERMRTLFIKAQGMSSEETSFRNLYLNQWDASPDKWITDEEWESVGDASLNIEDFKQYPCYIGMDLSARDDLTSAVALFDVDGVLHLFPYFFISGDNLAVLGERHKQDYVGWHRDGHIISTIGGGVDYELIGEWMANKFAGFDVRNVKIDILFQGASMSNILTDAGFVVEAGKTDWKTTSPAGKRLERRIKRSLIKHNANPVMRWNMNNVQVKIDSNANLIFSKKGNKNKVDGLFATLFGMSGMTGGDEPSGMPLAVLSGVTIKN